MKRAIALILIVVGAIAWFALRPSEEKRISERFESLSTNISKGVKESTASMAFKSQYLDSLLAEHVTLSTSRNMMNGTFSREEFSALIFRVRGMFKVVRLSFYDLQIVVDGDAAAVIGTAKLDLTAHQGETASEVREITAQLRKIEGKWRFAEFIEEQVLEK